MGWGAHSEAEVTITSPFFYFLITIENLYNKVVWTVQPM